MKDAGAFAPAFNTINGLQSPADEQNQPTISVSENQ